MKLSARGFCALSYVEKVKLRSGVTLPQNRFTQFLSNELISSVEDQLRSGLQPTPVVNPSPLFCLIDAHYQRAVRESPFGGFEVFGLRERTFFAMGMNYGNVGAESLWRILKWSRPDVLLLHVPPDELFPDFRLNLANPATGQLSNRLYFAQLLCAPGSLRGDARREAELCAELGVSAADDCSNSPGRKSALRTYACKAKITERVLALSLLYSRLHSVPIVMADLPDIVLRQLVVNRLTVSQLRQLHRQAITDGVFNPDMEPAFPLHLAHLSQPALLLRPSDDYTASLLQYIMHRSAYKRIFGFFGSGQAASVKSILAGRSPTAIAQTLETPPLRENVLGEAPLEDLVEKLAIYDVLKLGEGAAEGGHPWHKNTWAVLEKFSGLTEKHPKAKYCVYLYKQLVRDHLRRREGHLAEAKRHLEETFTKTMLKNPELR